MKKGDKVLVDVSLFKAYMAECEEADKRLIKKFGKMQSFGNFKKDCMIARNEILKRAEEKMPAIITKKTDNYCNLKFEDGFECGVEGEFLIKNI